MLLDFTNWKQAGGCRTRGLTVECVRGTLMPRGWCWSGRTDGPAGGALPSQGPAIPPLSLWAQILRRGLYGDGLPLPLLLSPSCCHPLLLPSPRHLLLLLLVSPEGDVRVPLHIGGVQQGFQGVRAEQGGAARPGAGPPPVAVVSCCPDCFGLGDGDVGESQLKGVLPWRAPHRGGGSKTLVVVCIAVSTDLVVGPLAGRLQLTQLGLLIATWTKKQSKETCWWTVLVSNLW